MGILQLNQLASAIQHEYEEIVDLSDVSNPTMREAAKKTRGLAAWVLARECGLEQQTAADAVVDGFGDDGIDLIWTDTETHVAYILQSKWTDNGTGSIRFGDTLKFLQGVRHFINGEFENFKNERLRRRVPEFERAIEDLDLHLHLVIAHSGSGTLSEESDTAIQSLLADMNDSSTSDTAEFHYLRQQDLHNLLRTSARGSKPDIETTLYDWGAVDEPYQAVYGQVLASDVASWYQKNGSSILADNIRQFLGDSDVNQSISDTLEHTPQHFWYLNNGITALCSDLKRAVSGSVDKRVGRFRFSNVSIVNGAQTAGCISRTSIDHPEKVADARVTVRFISLAGCPPEFSQEVTRGTNTQNRVERRDFVSLDPVQDSLATELSLVGVKYAIKSGSDTPDQRVGFTITDATIALACADRDTDYSTQAKREVGRLWIGAETPDQPSQYRHLFHDRLAPLRVWRAVQILRAIDSSIALERSLRNGRHKMIGIHGNRLIEHCAFNLLDQGWDDLSDSDFQAEISKIPVIASAVYDSVDKMAEQRYSGNYLASVFKNASKCKTLASHAIEENSLLLSTETGFSRPNEG